MFGCKQRRNTKGLIFPAWFQPLLSLVSILFVELALCRPLKEKIEKRIHFATARAAEAREDSDSEWQEDLDKRLLLWKNKLDFFTLMVGMDLLPVDVPGDGNCCCWTLIALQSGGFLQTKLCTPEKALGVRQDP